METKTRPNLDERRGLPSASSLERYFACPGSYQLSKLVKPEEIPTSKDAAAGTRIHDARAAGDVSDLEMDEADLVKQMAETEQVIYAQWLDDYNIHDAEIHQEERVWLWEGNKRLVSARIDLFALSKSRRMALILDRKSGRKGVTPPARNWQLKGSLVILAANHSLVAGRVAIVQPFAKRQNPCDYSTDDIYGDKGAWDQLIDLLKKLEDPNAPRVVGTHCEHCPAKHICPEARNVLNEIAALKGLQWSTLAPDQKLKLWQSCKVVEKLLEQILPNIKHDVRNGLIPGLTLTKDQFPRVITSPISTYGTLATEFVPAHDDKAAQEFQRWFDESAEISVGAIEEYVRQKKGLTKDGAKSWVNEKLKAHITTTKREGYVTLVK